MEEENKWLPTIALVAFCLVAVTANFLLLLVFSRRRGLRTISNRFVINLLFINLLSSLLLVPSLIIDQEAGRWSSYIENLNVSTTEIITNHTGQSTGPHEVIFEKQIAQVIDGTLFQSNELFIDNLVHDLDQIDIVKTNVSVNFGIRPGVSVHFCEFLQFCLNFMCTASILSILLIGLDQYIAVIHPLRYHTHINKVKSIVFILATWLISTLFALVTSLTNTNVNFLRLCRPTRPNYGVLNETYATIYFLLIIALPFIGICLIYVFIYRAAHKNSARIRKRNTVTTNRALSLLATKPRGIPKVQSAPDFGNLKTLAVADEQLKTLPTGGSIKRTNSEKATHNKNIITSLKCKFSNASVFRYREESRTAKISILVIVMVLICYVPYGIMFVVNTTDLSGHLHTYNYVSLLLFASSNLLAPVLFAYRNKRIQRELRKFLSLTFARRPSLERKPRIVITNLEVAATVDCVVDMAAVEPFLAQSDVVVVECTLEIEEEEKKSILKRVCSKNWSSYKKCSFINVPDSCLDARGSFSSASTQISTEE